MLELQGFDAVGGWCRGEGVCATVGGEELDAGGAEFLASAGVGEMQFDAVAVGGVDEEPREVGAGVGGDEGDEGVEAGAIFVFVFGFVEEESERGAMRARCGSAVFRAICCSGGGRGVGGCDGGGQV
jgi:hypothetical protein